VFHPAILEWQRHALAAGEFVARNLAWLAPKAPDLEAAVRRDAGPGGLTAEPVLETPFVRVLRLAAGERRRRIVLLTPHSGYASSALSPLVASLLPLGEVWATDWRDARLVPAAAGAFDLRAQVRLAAELIAADPGRPPPHLVGVSQSGPPLLAAAALVAAAAPRLRPASLSLLGSQIDVRVAPRQFQALLRGWPKPLAAAQLTAPVPPGLPGAGRRAFPGLLLLLALAGASPDAYLAAQGGLALDLLEGADRGFARQHADLHGVIDVPAELFLDMLDWAVYRPALDGSALRLGAESVGLRPLARVPLLTVEAAADELVGPGQTHALHRALGGADPDAQLTLPGARHPDLFTGPLFLRALAPALRRFVRRAEP
jgi:poly(3-hydroxybutyrate) depolymerase